MVAMMRADDARARGVAGYADIIGCGTACAGEGSAAEPGPEGLLLALRRAYDRAGAAPAEVTFLEGHAAGTACFDTAELTALTTLRAGARQVAALGGIKANIGDTRAAAGVAGLLKAVLAMSAGVLPPSTGCERPHPLLRDSASLLRVLTRPEPWPDAAKSRLSGVTAMGVDGTSAHVLLRRADDHVRRRGASKKAGTPTRGNPGFGAAGGAEAGVARPFPYEPGRRLVHLAGTTPPPRTEVYAFSGDDPAELAATLTRIGGIATWLSDGERHDLACQQARLGHTGRLRVAFAAASATELARRARHAAQLVTRLTARVAHHEHGVFAGDGVRGRVVLLFAGQGPGVLSTDVSGQGWHEADAVAEATAAYRASRAALRWLDRLGVTPAAAVGHGTGELTALAWAGCLSAPDAADLVSRRTRAVTGQDTRGAAMLSVSTDPATARALAEGTDVVIAAYNGPHAHVLAGSTAALNVVAERAARGGIATAMLPTRGDLGTPATAGCAAALADVLSSITFGPLRRRVISTVTGRELTPREDIRALLCEQLTAPVRFHEAVRAAARVADLFCEADPGRALASLAAQCCPLPVISTGSVGNAGNDGRRTDAASANAAAALFAAGAANSLEPMFAGRTARPIDIWRERLFCTDPRVTVQNATVPNPTAEHSAGHASGGAPMLPQPQGHPTEGNGQTPWGEGEIPGVGPWIRCFAEVTHPIPEPATAPPSGPWRLRVTPRQPLRKIIGETFTDHARADCVLACIADASDPDAAGLLLEAAREALGCGGLIVISHGGGLAGFLRSLHAEHPQLGVTLLRVAQSREGIRRARRFAHAQPGVYREMVLADGDPPAVVAAEPVAVTGTGETPLAVADVVLLTGGAGGIGLPCAQAIASTGAAVALVGRGDPASDPAVRTGLERLRSAGACAGYEPADVTDPGAMRAAVHRLEERLGPVTALVYLAGTGPPRPFAELTAEDIRAEVRARTAGLASALASLRPGRLRLVVTFGSVAGWYGQAGECHHALADAALRDQAERLALRAPGCRVLHISWPAWSGTNLPGSAGEANGLGMAAGPWPAAVAPIPASAAPFAAPAAPFAAPAAPFADPVAPVPACEAGSMLLRLIASSGLARVLAVHGRAGLAPARIAWPGRFVAEVRVHYPGVELVADAALGPDSDPYLADYRLDGQATLPAALGLEAMAQAAAVLAARPLRQARDVMMASQLAICADGSARIRVCALHYGDRVETVLRSAETRYGTEHLRAVFPVADPPPGGAVSSGAVASGAVSSGAVYDGRARGGGPDHMSTGIVDGTELYGSLCFQAGRFRRVAFLPELTSRSYRALVRGADDAPWFGLGMAEQPLLLGSPGVNDAAIHAPQACVPHRRLRPTGCENMTVTGLTIDGAVEVRAHQRSATADEYVWDVEAVDRHGRHVAVWTGLRLADTGPLSRTQPWPPALLAAYLERGAIALGLDPKLRVRVRAGHPRRLSCGCWEQGMASGHSGHANGSGAASGGGGGAGSGAGGGFLTSGLFFVGSGQAALARRSHLDGLTLTVDTAGPAACDWEATGARRSESLPFAPDCRTVYDQLRDRCGERPETVRSRIWTAAQCLRKAALPSGSPLAVGAFHDDGWVLLRAADSAIASAVVTVSGGTDAVAVAIMTSVSLVGD